MLLTCVFFKHPNSETLIVDCTIFVQSIISVSLLGCLERFRMTWNENARTKQKQQKNGNRAIWLVYRTDKNARGFWLVQQTLGWKNFMPENFLEINRYFALTSYCNTIGQSNTAFSVLGFSFVGKQRGHLLIFSFIG